MYHAVHQPWTVHLLLVMAFKKLSQLFVIYNNIESKLHVEPVSY